MKNNGRESANGAYRPTAPVTTILCYAEGLLGIKAYHSKPGSTNISALVKIYPAISCERPIYSVLYIWLGKFKADDIWHYIIKAFFRRLKQQYIDKPTQMGRIHDIFIKSHNTSSLGYLCNIRVELTTNCNSNETYVILFQIYSYITY